MEALVVGAGVVGLSCAIRLQEAGAQVSLRARERTPATTSDVAAAYLYPSRMAPDPRIVKWGIATRRELATLAGRPGTGVTPAAVLQLAHPGAPFPWWAPVMEDLRPARADELLPGHEAGWVANTFVAQMPLYMRYLEARFQEGGGTMEHGIVDDFQALAQAERRLVVNCTGLGARETARDPDVHPIRGQIVRVENPGLTRVLSDPDGPLGLAYVVPRATDVVLGGTAQPGDWNLDIDPATEAEILRKCVTLEPRLRGARITGRAVGLRPGRSSVRLAREGNLVHCYGHGGSGMTLSWGCADEVAALAMRG